MAFTRVVVLMVMLMPALMVGVNGDQVEVELKRTCYTNSECEPFCKPLKCYGNNQCELWEKCVRSPQSQQCYIFGEVPNPLAGIGLNLYYACEWNWPVLAIGVGVVLLIVLCCGGVCKMCCCN